MTAPPLPAGNTAADLSWRPATPSVICHCEVLVRASSQQYSSAGCSATYMAARYIKGEPQQWANQIGPAHREGGGNQRKGFGKSGSV